MALVDTDKVSEAAAGFSTLPLMRQVGVIVGVAACIALAMFVIDWARTPNFRPLYSQMNPQDAGKVLDSLNATGIPSQINSNTGSVMVPGNRIHEARMHLASQGINAGGGMGLEMLQNGSSFGTSQFMEQARYMHAIEGELARTISSFQNVRSARVHLAVPKQSTFIRDKKKASASVFLDLYSGRFLESHQIAAVVNLVSSSVPQLNSDGVTVVDQEGRLLTEGGNGSDDLAVANRQFEYTRQLEKSYSKRIIDMLTPILGHGKVKAQVSADIDFTQIEQTQERYNPDMPALRSEQVVNDARGAGATAGGIPGALSNKPGGTATAGGDGGSGNSRHLSTRNYELDKVISHTKQHVGRIRRVSVAVLVDDKSSYNKNTGQSTKTVLTEEEMTSITGLIKEAVGFNPQRGDTVKVINKSFAVAPPVEELPALGMLEQPWVWDMAKQGLGGVFILLLVFGIIRPFIKGLAEKAVVAQHLSLPSDGGKDKDDADAMLPPPPKSYQQQMEVVQSMVEEDPKRVAQVVKTWVDE